MAVSGPIAQIDGNVLSDMNGTGGEFSPAQKLAATLLRDAIAAYRRGDVETKKHATSFREAEHWLLSKDDLSYPASLANVCAILRIDPEYVRNQLGHGKTAPR